jgi:DNA repair exonuclease SbcCD ATPase subunit
MADNMIDRFTALRQKIAETDRTRAQAEAAVAMAKQRLTEIDEQIKALGVDPAKAEAELETLRAHLQKELAAIDTALAAETAAYQQVLQAAR